MLDVELWQKPFNNGKNTLPIIRVANTVFAYGKDGLHVYPTKASTRPTTWQKLGETALEISKITAKAFEIQTENFLKFDPINANSVEFAKTFATALVEMAKNNPIWEELSQQDWSKANIDVKAALNTASKSSSFGSFSSSNI